jgi:hypothetical protein
LTRSAYPLGISGNNIVGFYLDSSDNAHGFLYNDSTQTYTTLDDPLAGSGYFGTYACGISGNNIVGYYQDSSGQEHGFETTIPTPEPSTFALLSVGAICLGGYSLRLRRKNRMATVSEESPAILTFPSRSFDAKRKAA